MGKTFPVRTAALLACLLWAVSFIATKEALRFIPPLAVTALRLAAAALCFAPLLVLRRAIIFKGGWERLGRLFILSLFGTGLHYGIQTFGLQYTTASNASLWAMACPVCITLIAAFFLGERVTLKKAAGVCLALCGVAAVLWPVFAAGLDLRSHLAGDGLVFLSIFLWALFTVYGKKITAEMGAFEVIGSVTVIGAIWMAPAGIWEMGQKGLSLSAFPAASWAAVAFLGAGCSFLAALLYFLALEKTESQKVGVYLYTIPPMTYLFAALFLGEHIGLPLIAGSLLVAAGVYLTERG